MTRFQSRLGRRAALLLMTVTVLIGVTMTRPATAVADPPFVGWTAVLPPASNAFEPDSSDACAAGRPTCVQKTLRAMNERLAPLAAACHHNAVFSLAYLRTTEFYQRAAQEPGFFADNAFVAHEDALFARYYWSAYDHWSRGDRAYVPEAWRLALDAAAASEVTGTGDLLLGMSAHVNRDLPFVLATIGLVTADGTTRKRDHDQVNVFLNRVVQPLIDEEARRFDPTMDDADSPSGLSYTGLMQLLLTWREGAWRHAEQLVDAPDDAARAAVAQQIEDGAAVTARSIVQTQAYRPPVTSTQTRDGYCAVHHG